MASRQRRRAAEAGVERRGAARHLRELHRRDPLCARDRVPRQRAGQARRARDDGEPPRIAILADGIGSTHGVTRTIEEIRGRGVPGFEIEVVATDPDVDRRLPR